MRNRRGHELPPFLGRVRPVEFADRLLSHEVVGSSVLLHCSTLRHDPEIVGYYGTATETVVVEPSDGRPATLTVDFWSRSVIRFRYAPGDPGRVPPSASRLEPPDAIDPMISGSAEAGVRLAITSRDSELVIRSEALELIVKRETLQLVVRDLDGRILWSTRTPSLDALASSTAEPLPAAQIRWPIRDRYAYPLGVTVDPDDRHAFVSFNLRHDERIVGFGQAFGRLDRSGTSQVLWIQEALGNSSPASYIRAPFYTSSQGHGVFVHTSDVVTAHVGSIDHTALSIIVDDSDVLDWFVIGGQPREVLAGYAAISGAAALPPRWSFGLWMSRLTYRSRDEVERVADELRRRRIPSDVIHIDTGWFEREQVCDFEFSQTRFPEPEIMTAQLLERGFHVSVWQWPYYTLENPLLDEARQRHLLAERTSRHTYLLEGGWNEDAGLLDVSNPDAISWFQGKLRRVLDAGVSAIKVDFGEGAPNDALYARIGSTAMHNLYPVLYQKAVWDATQAARGQGESVIWARSGWSGSQRYPVHWSGDSLSRFEDLACVLRSMLSMSMSGFAFYSHDVGGFWGHPSPELYVRWMQLGAFSTHVRCHGQPPREPWSFGDDAERHVRSILELRYRLLPYLWTSAADGLASSVPMVRPLLVDWPDDPIAWRVDDQYMFGPGLLVAPILDAGATSRRVYLPAGRWWDYWSGRTVDGGRFVTADAPIERIPLYVKDGAMLPMGPIVQSVDERPTDPLELHFWGQPRDGSQSIRLAQGIEARAAWESNGGNQRVTVAGAPGRVEVIVHDERGVRVSTIEG